MMVASFCFIRGFRVPSTPLFFHCPAARASASPMLWRRRVPLVGAFWVLSLGALGALVCKSGARYSLPFLPLFRSELAKQSQSQRTYSAAMDSASSTVPSIVVYVTVPNREAGKKLAESIIQNKLAACVNRVPGIESVYWWDDKVQTDSEELLIIKTRESLLDALTDHVKLNHEYEVPEVISLPITGGNLKYLEWIKNSTRD